MNQTEGDPDEGAPTKGDMVGIKQRKRIGFVGLLLVASLAMGLTGARSGRAVDSQVTFGCEKVMYVYNVDCGRSEQDITRYGCAGDQAHAPWCD